MVKNVLLLLFLLFLVSCISIRTDELIDVTSSFVANNGTRTLATLNWQPTITRFLPVDPLHHLKQSRQVHEASISFVEPSPIKDPFFIAYSQVAGELLDLDLKTELKEVQQRDLFAEYFSGNLKLPNSPPSFAHCYGGHQFGHWSGQLGDGRAISLGEIQNHKGEIWEVSLKGAGKTPYSRHGDGRAVLRSSIREFLCSEFMHALGVPTTRALSLIGSDENVMRDQFYDGHVKEEKGAVVARLAPSFIRFGSFEIFYYRKELQHIKTLADYVISFYFPHILAKERQLCKQAEELEKETESDSEYENGKCEGVSNSYRYRLWFKEIVERTARLVANWQSIGFAHGVLNTDNMSILGLTIDYGPFGFLDVYDPSFVPNTSDDEGRYAFSKQPEIVKWNLEKLGLALSPILANRQSKLILRRYDFIYQREYLRLMRRKLGLFNAELEEDENLINDLLDLMKESQSDYTFTFRALSSFDRRLRMETNREWITEHLIGDANYESLVDKWGDWLTRYHTRLNQDEEREEAKTENEKEKKTKKSKEEEEEREKKRQGKMKGINPLYVLRNHIAQRAIERAEGGDYEEVNQLLRLLTSPFEDNPSSILLPEESISWYTHPPPRTLPPVRVSCSS